MADRNAIIKLRATAATRQENEGLSFKALPHFFEARVQNVVVDIASNIETLRKACGQSGRYNPIKVWQVDNVTNLRKHIATWPAKQRHEEATATIQIRDGITTARIAF